MTDTGLSTSTVAAVAQAYMELGLPYLPVLNGRKHSVLAGEESRGTLSVEQMRATVDPAHLSLGTWLGGSGFLVIDLDMPKVEGEPFGEEMLQGVAGGLGLGPEDLKRWVPWSVTPSGGVHLWFRTPTDPELALIFGCHRWKPVEKVDVLSNGFLMLPPSSGGGYRWVRSPLPAGLLAGLGLAGPELEAEGVAVPELPAELAQALVTAMAERAARLGVGSDGGRLSSEEKARRLAEGSPSGARNDDVVPLVNYLRTRLGDAAQGEIAAAMERWRGLCDPPYYGPEEDAEYEKAWRSAWRYPNHRVSPLDLSALPFFQVAPEKSLAGSDEEVRAALDSLAAERTDGERAGNVAAALTAAEDAGQLVQLLLRFPGLADALRWVEGEARVAFYNPEADGGAWQVADAVGVNLYGQAMKELGLDGGLGVGPGLRLVYESAATDAELLGQPKAAAAARKAYVRLVERRALCNALADAAGHWNSGRLAGRFDLDEHAEYLFVRNGVVELGTGEMRTREWARAEGLMNTSVAPVDWGASVGGLAAARALLELYFPDAGHRTYALTVLGAMLYGDNRLRRLPVLQGGGRNGKSTFMAILEQTLGGGYMGVVPPKVLVDSKAAEDQHPTGLMDIVGYRLAVEHEWTPKSRLNGGLVKAVTGGDGLKVRGMGQDFRRVVPRCSLLIVSNVDVVPSTFEPAIQERMLLLQMDGVLPVERRRPLVEVLAGFKAAGGPAGLLELLVMEGSVRFAAAGLAPGGGLDELMAEKLADANPMSRFWDACVDAGRTEALGGYVGAAAVVTHGPEAVAAAGLASREAVYEAYRTWCAGSGVHSMAEQRFGQEFGAWLSGLSFMGSPVERDRLRLSMPGRGRVPHWPVVLVAGAADGAGGAGAGWRP